jgi:hypothetical protein
MNKDAEFQNLRAVGAFLVSASLKNGKVNEIKVTSEVGGVLKMILPWTNGGTAASRSGTMMDFSNTTIEMPTAKGETILFRSKN